jgi:GntR family transcriptional regulator
MPFHAQLADALEREIIQGRWKAGARIPGELEICEHFGLSRSPVRQALAALEQRGYIVRMRGLGSFVRNAAPADWLLQASEGFFYDEVDQQGRNVASLVLRSERIVLPDHCCEALGLNSGAPGVVLERLRSIEGRVALFVKNYLGEDLSAVALELVDPGESLYRRIADRTSIAPAGGVRKLWAIAADPEVAGHLELEPGAPVAFVRSTTWDVDCKPFDYYEAWFRTDRVSIETHGSGVARGSAAT